MIFREKMIELSSTLPDWITAIGTLVGGLATLFIAVISIRHIPEKVARSIRETSHLPQPLRDDPFMLSIYNILSKNDIHVEYDRHGAAERYHAPDNIVHLPYHKLPPVFATIRYGGGWGTETTKSNTYEIDCYSFLPEDTRDLAAQITKCLTKNNIKNQYMQEGLRFDEPFPTLEVEKHHTMTILADSPTFHRDVPNARFSEKTN